MIDFFGEFHYLFDYIRMVCYAMIILTDLRNIANRRFSTLLYVGDIVLAFGLFVAVANIPFTHFPQELVADKVLTPAAIIWAGIHYYEFLKKADNN